MKISIKLLLSLSWIIFFGVSIEAGIFIANLWQEADLSALLNYDRGYFFVITFIMSIVAVMKVWLFYLMVKMLHNRKETRRFFFTVAYITLVIGLFSKWGVKYAEWLMQQGVKMPDTQQLRLGSADVWLFISIILLVIALIFKKGTDIQKENELTI